MWAWGVTVSVVASPLEEERHLVERPRVARKGREGTVTGASAARTAAADPAGSGDLVAATVLDPEAVRTARVETLVLRNHVRSEGLDENHVAAFCELEGDWPPLLVWARQPEVVIDGAHRLAAAKRLGHDTVRVVAFDGTADQAFVEAVRRNVAHGLPLTVADRTRAGKEILLRHPHWSDRRIAKACGLSPHTVARLREAEPRPGNKTETEVKSGMSTSAAPLAARQSRAIVRGDEPKTGVRATQHRSTERIVDIVDIESRLGRDGRTRPAQPGLLRERVLEALRANPNGSLRQIATVAKVSPETVRRIRKEVDQPSGPDFSVLAALRAPAESDTDWHEDPALMSNEELVSWLDDTDPVGDLESFALSVPLSRVYELADEARRRAARWSAFAEVLESRARHRSYFLA